MINGKKVSLRSLEKEDLPLLRDWRNQDGYRKFFREFRELNLANQEAWFTKYVVNDPNTLMFGIIESGKPESLVGVCGLCYVNWVHRYADLSLYIGKDLIYIDTKKDGYAWGTLDVLLRYGFNELNLNKVWCEIYAFDDKKHELFNAYGFQKDGVLRQNYFYNGSYQDSVIYSLLAEEWRNTHFTKTVKE